MATLFRPTYRDQTGKKKRVSRWWCEVTDHIGVRRRFAGFTDKTETRKLAEKIERLVVCRLNNEPPGRELSLWLDAVPAKLRERFVKCGLLDSARAAGSKALTEHLADFEQSLLAKGNSPKHARLTATRAGWIIGRCRFVTWGEIRASKVERYLADLRERGLSIQSSNYYLQAIKQFCRWMVQDGRANHSPVQYLKPLNPRVDRRHDRAAFTPDEVAKLLAVTERQPTRYGMTGHERSLLYRLAVETGLRRNELASLTVSSFDFDRRTVTVAAAYSKHRRQDVLPLKPQTAAMLKAFVAGKLPNIKVFGGTYKQLTIRTSDMLKADLAAAGIPYRDEAGRYRDFHSLRHTTGSLLAAAGVHPKVAQSLMRHSTVELTMNRYTHIFAGQMSDAIDKLPDFAGRQVAAATGTDGKNQVADHANPQAKKLVGKLAGTAEKSCDFDRQTETERLNFQNAENAAEAAKNAVSETKMQVCGPVAQRQSSGLIIHWS